MLYVNAAIINGALLPVIIFFRSKPPTPPSSSAETAREDTFGQALKRLAFDKNFWILCIIFGFALGAYNTLATVLNEILKPFGYTDQQSGILGALVIVLGLVGSAVAGIVVDKTHWYKATIIVCLLGGTGAGVMMTLCLRPDNFILLAVSGAFLGFSITPVIPIGLELATEISFPLGEATPTGILLCSGQITGVGLIFGMSALIDKGYDKWPYYITVGCFVISLIASVLFNGKLKRLEHERKLKDLS